MKFLRMSLTLGALALAAACSSSGDKKGAAPSDGVEAEEKGESSQKGDAKVNAAEARQESNRGGPTKFVTSTLANESVVQGSVGPNVLSDAIVELDELTRKDPENVAMTVTYLALLRLHGQGAEIRTNIEKKAGGAGAKNPWFLVEAGYGALTRREWALADYLFAKAERNAGGNPNVKAAIQHAYGVRYVLEKKIQLGVAEMRKAATANYMPALLTLGFMGLRAGDFNGAERTFRAAMAVDGDNINARMGLSAALRARGKADEALPLLGPLYKARGQDRRVVWNYAVALSEVPSKRGEAKEVLEKYFQLSGSLGEIDTKANALLTKLNAATAAPAAPAAAPGGAAPAGK